MVGQKGLGNAKGCVGLVLSDASRMSILWDWMDCGRQTYRDGCEHVEWGAQREMEMR